AFRGSDRRITPAAARAATGRTNNYPGQFLSTDKNRQASPDAPKDTYAAVKQLANLKSLRNLDLTNTLISDVGARELKKSLPRLVIAQ
ncbi:MAG TPA: hypothetical protein VHX68_15190, partial [Planctomycetaceae bacterium]|nr:hypothetical protein [Planctomycetaceae bacterium]